MFRAQGIRDQSGTAKMKQSWLPALLGRYSHSLSAALLGKRNRRMLQTSHTGWRGCNHWCTHGLLHGCCVSTVALCRLGFETRAYVSASYKNKDSCIKEPNPRQREQMQSQKMVADESNKNDDLFRFGLCVHRRATASVIARRMGAQARNACSAALVVAMLGHMPCGGQGGTL